MISYALDAGRSDHGMNELAKQHLNHTCIAYEDVAGKGRTHIGLARVPIDKATEYAAEDADVTLRLWRVLKPRLTAERMNAVYETLERPLVRVLAQMERRGISIDRAFFRGFRANSPRASPGSKKRSRNLRARASIRAVRSNSAISCSARCSCPAAPRHRLGPGRRRRTYSRSLPRKAMSCRRKFSSGDS